MRKARFSNAYTFQYSKRPGTPAAEMADQLPKEVVQERYMRLLAVQEEVNIEENRKLVGTEVELLVAAGGGSEERGDSTSQWSRARRSPGAFPPRGKPGRHNPTR